jgi:hypothetical protein
MFRLARTAFASLLLIASVSASDEQKVEVRRDTEFPVVVQGTIKSASARIGDTVKFRTESPILIGNNIVVPENATILGTIIKLRRAQHDYPNSLIGIRIHTLRWKNYEAPLNAIVASIRHMHQVREVPNRPTFLEGVRVISHIKREAFTEFLSNHKQVTIRSGVSFFIRHVDPDTYPNDVNILTAKTQGASTD